MANLTEEQFNELNARYGAMGIKDLAITFRELKEDYDDKKAVAGLAYQKWDFLRKNIIPRIMDEMGLETAKVEGVGRVQVSHQISAKQKDKQALVSWLESNGHGGIVAETVNSSTLASFIKAQIAMGEAIPDDDIVGISVYDVASVVKA